MSEESLTLYKLMILFMLDNLDFPLTNSQLSEFFVKLVCCSTKHHIENSKTDAIVFHVRLSSVPSPSVIFPASCI